jgi:hypothetical protein
MSLYWRGIPVSQMPREELEQEFMRLYEKWTALHTPEEIQARAVGTVEMWRRKAMEKRKNELEPKRFFIDGVRGWVR